MTSKLSKRSFVFQLGRRGWQVAARTTALASSLAVAFSPAQEPTPATADVPIIISSGASGGPATSSLLDLSSSTVGSASFLGTGRIDLLGLGPSNTLTLINGRRAMTLPGALAVPLFGVSRVEVAKFGPSIVNGSDALGGTVNFVMLGGPGTLKYNGSEIDLFYGASSKGGSTRAVSFTTGFSNEKLSLVFGAGFVNQSATTLSSNRYSPYGNATLPGYQAAQYFGAFDYKLSGNAMQIYGDFMITDARVDATAASRARLSRAASGLAGYPDGGFNARSYRTMVGLKGAVPLPNSVLPGISYDVGFVYDQNKLSDSDEGDFRRTSPRRPR